MDITESLLEMHYHRAILEAFASVFGARFMRLLKPSPQREAWVGFDQGWVHTSMQTEQLFAELRAAVASPAGYTSAFYLGYFLQFKVVDQIMRASRRIPLQPRFYRSTLSLKPNRTTGLSQHETLCRLSALPQASVSYVCPCLFDLDDLYRPADLSTLQIVDVRSSPAGWATNQSHFIAFRSPSDPQPLWCSEPTQGAGDGAARWMRSDSAPRPMSGAAALDLIEMATGTLLEVGASFRYRRYSASPALVLPVSFALASFGQQEAR